MFYYSKGLLTRLRNVKRITLNVTKEYIFVSNVDEYICSSENACPVLSKNAALSIISHLTEVVIIIPVLLMEWEQ